MVENVLVIGDIHSDFTMLKDIVDHNSLYRDLDLVIQVGDFGFFPNFNVSGIPASFSHYKNTEFLFIRGNHEEHDEILKHRIPVPRCLDAKYAPFKYVPDGFFLPDPGILFVGGAWSIDGPSRNYTNDIWMANGKGPYPHRWFKDSEEVSEEKFDIIIDFASKNNHLIKMLITHDGPGFLYPKLCNPAFGSPKRTRTGNKIDELVGCLTNTVHIFGHHHKHLFHRDMQTRNVHICLDMVNNRTFSHCLEYSSKVVTFTKGD